RCEGQQSLRRGWTAPPRQELAGLLERTAQAEKERNDGAADEQRHAPAPLGHRRGRERLVEDHADQRREHHGHLLARRLPAHIERLVAGRRDPGGMPPATAESIARGAAPPPTARD